ncbi:MAG: hypothetical protein SCM96_11315 [Acidobacteriota bacterium]|nr:hypothetical protein [Acidobacteriota bacterium]
MSAKHIAAIAGLLLILGAGWAQAGEQTKAQSRHQVRNMFIDQNGDGINDFIRDHDNDGIPNCQDPDWNRPEDGTGYQNRHMKGSANQFGNRKGFQGSRQWNNSSFRNGQNGLGGGICDGTGPKGNGLRKGRG